MRWQGESSRWDGGRKSIKSKIPQLPVMTCVKDKKPMVWGKRKMEKQFRGGEKHKPQHKAQVFLLAPSWAQEGQSTCSWAPVEVSLPYGYKISYCVEVGLQEFGNLGDCWFHDGRIMKCKCDLHNFNMQWTLDTNVVYLFFFQLILMIVRFIKRTILITLIISLVSLGSDGGLNQNSARDML